jgi:hypothetical protein
LTIGHRGRLCALCIALAFAGLVQPSPRRFLDYWVVKQFGDQSRYCGVVEGALKKVDVAGLHVLKAGDAQRFGLKAYTRAASVGSAGAGAYVYTID